MAADGPAQVVVPGEGQVAVAVVIMYGELSGLNGCLWREQIGVKVFKAQHFGVAAGRLGHLVDGKTGNSLQSFD
ncbi:hypothetical protein SDC9_146603 [bioreactor metagenome]|uniref:Uncharacterized protein n=1 Tax=bioreactor metagenome TaxID=1076179 RepID=A0A645EFP2_9ZZZZ